MKKFLAILLSALLLLTLIACSPEEDLIDQEDMAAPDNSYTNNDGLGTFTYDINKDGHYSITGYSTYSSSKHTIVIPDMIDDIKVTGIGAEAFKSCTSITAVTIPSSITFIDELAFYGCDSLTTVTIPDSVTEIGVGAFQNCESLKEITLSAALTAIPDRMLQDCTALEAITLPNDLISIGKGAFWECDALTEVLIPWNVATVDELAFYGCDSLAKIFVNTPNLKTIGDGAFGELTSEKVSFFVLPGDEVFTQYFEENFAINSIDYGHYELNTMQD